VVPLRLGEGHLDVARLLPAAVQVHAAKLLGQVDRERGWETYWRLEP
jgi:hypothetical protein